MRYIDRFIRKSTVDLNPGIHGGRIAELINESEIELLDFSANINPQGPPDIHKITVEELNNIDRYPDNRYLKFRVAAAKFAGVNVENIIPTNGSSELIRLIAETILDNEDTVILPQPTFDEYEVNIRLMGAVADYVKYEDVYQSQEAITDKMLAGSRSVFICNPNNPTGTLISRADMEKLADRCQEFETFLVIDEAFIELCDPSFSMCQYVHENPFIIIIRSLTKTFAIPGMRIGYGIAHQDVASKMNDLRITWNLGSIPAAVGAWLMSTYSKDPSYIESSREMINIERDWLNKRLTEIRGFNPISSQTNFILIDIHDFAMNSKEITGYMQQLGILIRDCSSFWRMGLNYIRVAVRTREENQRLIDAFGESINLWGKDLAKKNLREAMQHGRIFSKTDCEYYPCHFEGQDCTFCFCPFYPCMDERTAGEMIDRSTGGQVWSCMNCDLLHRQEIATPILDALMHCKGGPQDLKRIWKTVVEPLL